jgi:CHAT domain/Subtilase family
MSGYDDFGLGLQVGAGGQIWVSAASRLGHVHGVTSVEPGSDVLEELFLQLYDLLDAIRFAEAFDATPISEALGSIAFGEPVVRELFQAARGAAADRGRQLIVRVQAAPQLAALPWELLPDPSSALEDRELRHLALSPDVHVVRLPRGRTYPNESEPLSPPLNLLVVLSSPMGEQPEDDTLTFDIYQAKRDLLAELGELESGGWLNVDVEDRPTMENLQRRIGSKRRGYHLLHYLGHAEPDLLLLEDEQGRRRDANGTQLVEWLQTCPDLRLVTFAGCETARPGGDPETLADTTKWQVLLSLAERASQGSSPLVLGMQAVLPFRTEWLLTRALYQALASGNTIVDALRLARHAVRSDEQVRQGLLDWAIPALFMTSEEPAPLLERTGAPPPRTRRACNVTKLDPPPAGAGLIGRDVALRQAVEVLAGRTSERVLLISGGSGTRARELLDRSLDEIVDEVSDVVSAPYSTLTDEAEAGPFLAATDGDVSLEKVLRANLCAAVSQHLQRSDSRSRERRREWTLRRWWAWLAEDLADRRAVIAIDGLDVLRLTSEPVRVLAGAWLAKSFPASGQQDTAGPDLAEFVEQLRDPGPKRQREKSERLVRDFLSFVGGSSDDPVAREVLADEAEDLLNVRVAAAWTTSKPTPRSGRRAAPPTAEELDRRRRELKDVRAGITAVAEMLTKVVRRSQTCRVALVVDEPPEGFLREIDDLVFPMRLGEITWPEMWRWIRRNLPGLRGFGQDRLDGVWRKYLGSEVGPWHELEQRVRTGAVNSGFTSPGDDAEGVETPESGLEHLALQIASRRVARRREVRGDAEPRSWRRQDRPLVVAAAASFGDDDSSDSGDDTPWQLPFATFHARLKGLAEAHGVGGRVTTTTAYQQDTLVVLVPVPSPFSSGGAQTSDILLWYEKVAASQPDILLLDFGSEERSEIDERVRRALFPAHRTLQIAAGGNTPTAGPIWPAWDDDVLSVGALGEDGRIREFSTRSRAERKPDVFAADTFEPGDKRRGTSFAAANVVVAAILVWTLLPERTARGLRGFLLQAAKPLEPRKSRKWPRRLDLDEAVAAARRERVEAALRRGGRASIQAIVAMTGLNWQWAKTTLDELDAANRVAPVSVGRGGEVYELLEAG